MKRFQCYSAQKSFMVGGWWWWWHCNYSFKLQVQVSQRFEIDLDIETSRVHMELTWTQPGPDLDRPGPELDNMMNVGCKLLEQMQSLLAASSRATFFYKFAGFCFSSQFICFMSEVIKQLIFCFVTRYRYNIAHNIQTEHRSLYSVSDFLKNVHPMHLLSP